MKKLIALFALATSLLAFGGKTKELDEYPTLETAQDSGWVIMIRDKDRRTNEWGMRIIADGSEMYELEDNQMVFFRLPAGEQKIMVNGNAGEEEYMVVNVQTGKFYYIFAQYIDISMSEDIVLTLLDEADLKETLDEADDIHKMEFYIASPEKMKDKKWVKWEKRYEKWKSDDMDDYNEYMAMTGFDTQYTYSFEKR